MASDLDIRRLETGAATGADDGRTASFPVRLDGRDIYLNLESNLQQGA